MTNDIFEAIDQFTPEQIEVELERVNAEMGQLDAKRDLLLYLLRLKTDITTSLTTGSGKSQQWAVSVGQLIEDGEPTGAGTRADSPEQGDSAQRSPAKRERTSKRGTSKREPIRKIMASNPFNLWTPREVHAALRDQGIDVSLENVRITLKRMSDRGQIRREKPGVYRAPATHEELEARRQVPAKP